MINTTLRMIFTEDEIHRLTITEYKNKKAHIIVDVHGMKCSQVRRFINNIINSVRTAFQLMIIHGYNRGTAIKEMLAHNFNNSNIIERYQDAINYGITHILVG